MSQQGPILVVSTARRPSFAAALDLAKLFPVVETEWADAVRAVEQVQPAAVLAATSDTDAAGLTELAARVAALEAAVKAADSKIQDALRTAAEAVTTAQDAVRQTQAALAKMGTLRAKGLIDVPVVVENLSRARAKGDVDLALE